MRRILIMVTALFCAVSAFAYSSRIRDIAVDVNLFHDGSALITETWDVCVASGTEWYLVRNNLGDIVVSDLSVEDESGLSFFNEGEWDIDRGMERKAGRCGIVSKRNGVEICWGVGSYGDHRYRVRYRMSNVVKSLDDYDCLHMQFVSPGLSSNPEHVSVNISAPVGLTLENARVWGFGFEGMTEIEDGKARAWSTSRLGAENSLIMLLRFDKGIFESASVRDGSFESVLERAMDGADFGEDDDDRAGLIIFICMILTCIGLVLGAFISDRRKKKKILGCLPSEVQWSRDVPYEGNIYSCFSVLQDLGIAKSTSNLASAAVLRMVYDGVLGVRKAANGDIEICFTDKDVPEGYDENSLKLYNFIKEAAGADGILQKKEFSRWGKNHYAEVEAWAATVKIAGARALREKNMQHGTPQGQFEARKAVGFRKFLQESTLIGERSTPEVGLWRDYLVYGSLFGVAKKVADELKEINPDLFKDLSPVAGMSPYDMVYLSNSFDRSMRSAQDAYRAAQAARSGMGGSSSIGGGGGFSGGGFGGGSR